MSTAIQGTAPEVGLKVLVVDDQDMQRMIVRRALGKLGHQVLEASSAEQALELMDREVVDVVLSDWVMDGMDGTELCQCIRKAVGRPYTYFVLMSSRNSREDLLEGMQAGADDFLRKPLDVEELAVRLRAGQRVLALQAHLRARQAELEAAHGRIQHDIHAASAFQRGLLPKHAPQQSAEQVGWLFLASNTVSGDALNYFPLDERRLAFYLMDVSGHGVAAAMVAMNVAQYLNPAVGGCVFKAGPGPREVLRPEDTVAELNQRLCMHDLDGRYLTCVYGLLDRVTGELNLVRAGHPRPLLVRADGQVQAFPGDGDMPVALFPGAEFTASSVRLAPGDRVVIYSDGVTECEDHTGEAFGEERLLQFFKSMDQEPISSVTHRFAAAIGGWSGYPERDLPDDVSLLIVEHLPIQPPSTA